MIDTDLAFEKSQVKATLINEVKSIKNPYKGKIILPKTSEKIITDSKAKAKIIETNLEKWFLSLYKYKEGNYERNFTKRFFRKPI